MEIELGQWYVVHIVARGNIGFIMTKAQLSNVEFDITANSGVFYFTLEYGDGMVVSVPQSWISAVEVWVDPTDPGDGGDPEPTE